MRVYVVMLLRNDKYENPIPPLFASSSFRECCCCCLHTILLFHDRREKREISESSSCYFTPPFTSYQNEAKASNNLIHTTFGENGGGRDLHIYTAQSYNKTRNIDADFVFFHFN